MRTRYSVSVGSSSLVSPTVGLSSPTVGLSSRHDHCPRGTHSRPRHTRPLSQPNDAVARLQQLFHATSVAKFDFRTFAAKRDFISQVPFHRNRTSIAIDVNNVLRPFYKYVLTLFYFVGPERFRNKERYINSLWTLMNFHVNTSKQQQ